MSTRTSFTQFHFDEVSSRTRCCSERNIDDPTLERLIADVEHRDRLRGATIGLWTAAVVTAAVGVILVVTDRR